MRNRRAEFFATISSFFDFQRNRTGKAILLFLCGFISLGVLINALYGAFGLLMKLIIQRSRRHLVAEPREALINSALEVATVVMLFYLIYRVMRHYSRRDQSRESLTLKPPVPHQGLILLLGPYNPHIGKSRFETPDKIELEASDARLELLKSNWGPLVVACQHHAIALRCCWLVCTAGERGSAAHFDSAVTVIKKFTGKKVHCEQVLLDDPNDVSQIVPKIEAIYQNAALAYNLESEQIIADFTGGTAAMSGGLILATIPAERKIEYMRQDKKPLHADGSALTTAEIIEQEILITIVTSPTLLPPAPSGASLPTARKE